jgi:hypothetical protein
MTVTYRTAGAWGAGIGRNLTPAEVDTNFYTLAELIEALENYPASAVIPTNVSRVGSQITFSYSNGSSFTLTDPVASTPVPATGATVTTTSFGPVLANANQYIRCTNSVGCSITVPTNSTVAFPLWTELHFRQANTGGLAFIGAIGVTINVPDGFENGTVAEGATVTLKKVAENEWDLFGLLVATASA